MKEFGEYLRQERMSRGVTLEAIQKRTRIRMQYLIAMEQGEFSRLPEPAYVKAFLRHYATCVGLNPNEVIAQYEALAGAGTENAPERTSAGGDRWVERRVRRHRARRRRRLLFWLVLLAVAAVAVSVRLWGSPWTWFDFVDPAASVPQVEADPSSERTEISAPGEDDSPEPPAHETGAAGRDAQEPVAVSAGDHEPVQVVLEDSAGPIADANVPETDLRDPGEAAATSSAVATVADGGTVSSEAASANHALEGGEVVDNGAVPEPAALAAGWDVFRRDALGPGSGPFVVPAAENGYLLELRTTDRSWVELWVDGVRRVYRNVEAGEYLAFHVQGEASMRFGRAEYVELTIDSVYLGPVGVGVVDKRFISAPRDAAMDE